MTRNRRQRRHLFAGRLLPVLLLVSAVWLVQACTTNPATGDADFTAFMSPERELEVGAEEHPKILQSFGGSYPDAALEAYVNKVGRKIARVSDLPDLTFHFTVLNDTAVNAFALPGGYIYLTRGLMAFISTEAEMAGVLAHEISHVTARHAAQRYSAAVATDLGLSTVSLVGAIFGIPAGLFSPVLSQSAQLALQSYSREQELEADLLAVRYMARAGYEPSALETFFRKLKLESALRLRRQGRSPDDDQSGSLLSTHPRTVDRIAQAIDLARITPVTPEGGQKSREPGAKASGTEAKTPPYLNHINGLPYGSLPDQGVVQGREFLHPGLGIRFKVPPGFDITNSKTHVIARGPGRAVLVFDRVRREIADKVKSVAGYLRKWSDGRLDDVEAFEVNGLEAATGMTRISTQNGMRNARLVAIRERPGRIYRLLFITPPEVNDAFSIDFRESLHSFRRLTATEAARAKPLRIRVLTVQKGDTQEKLADLMPVGPYRLAMFRALNGLAEDAPLTPGGKVKVVTP